MLTPYEIDRLRNGLKGTGGYFERCLVIAKHAFLNGSSLDDAIRTAKKKFDF